MWKWTFLAQKIRVLGFRVLSLFRTVPRVKNWESGIDPIPEFIKSFSPNSACACDQQKKNKKTKQKINPNKSLYSIDYKRISLSSIIFLNAWTLLMSFRQNRYFYLCTLLCSLVVIFEILLLQVFLSNILHFSFLSTDITIPFTKLWQYKKAILRLLSG